MGQPADVAGRLADRLDPAGAARHPSVWMADELDEEAWSKQDEVLDSVFRHRRTAVPACYDVGKSFAASRLAAWWIDEHPPGSAFVVSTAPTAPQVRAILWREINRAHRKGQLGGRVNQTEWWLALDGLHRTAPHPAEQMVGMGRKPSEYNAAAFQGIHERFVLVIIDEAAGVPGAIARAAEGLVANDDSRILAIGNPEASGTWFADACQPGSGWNTVHISAFDSPNLTGERVASSVAAELVSEQWVEEMREKWGEDSPLWQSKVLGRFPDEGEQQLYARQLCEEAVELDLSEELTGGSVLGVDVARFGANRTVIVQAWAEANRARVELLRSSPKSRTTETSGWVVQALAETGAAAAHVDGAGIGGGVVDELVEQGKPVADLNAGAASKEPERFYQARDEWYWNLRTRLEDGTLDLPEDGRLFSQLTAVRYSVDSRGRIRVESKAEMEKRGVPSPDELDAVVLALADVGEEEVETAVPAGATQTSSWY